MQFSESSNLQKKAERENSPAASSLFLACGIWATRIIIGIVFIFSGWVKAVDPWGTIFKINDYAAALHLSLPQEVMVVAAFLLCAAEFCLGVMVLSGVMRRTSAWCLLMFM
ncbi:MAG: DoxX family protein, partial [Bacteroidales bacterium]|nr:DoxX family protein [Bacteroidales bacterium]